MIDIKQFLSLIGFNKNEAIIYETLLELGTSSVHEISEKTKIHRTNIYDALKKLFDKGLVLEINAEKKLFSARPIKSLKDYFKFKEDELDELIKEYENKTIKKQEEYKFKISQGTFALREAVLGLLEPNKPIDVFGIPPKAPEIMGLMLKGFHKSRIKRKIFMRHIYNSSAIERVKYLNKNIKMTEARILPKKYDSNATTCITGNNIVIFLWEEKDVTVLEIKDVEIAKAYKNYFEILWDKAKKD